MIVSDCCGADYHITIKKIPHIRLDVMMDAEVKYCDKCGQACGLVNREILSQDGAGYWSVKPPENWATKNITAEDFEKKEAE